MADRELSEDEVADLKEAFAMFDINGDGKISFFLMPRVRPVVSLWSEPAISHDVFCACCQLWVYCCERRSDMLKHRMIAPCLRVCRIDLRDIGLQNFESCDTLILADLSYVSLLFFRYH